MLRCPQCDARSHRNRAKCPACDADLTGSKPLPPAGVPRRFGIQKALLLTALYAAVFALLSWLDSYPAAFAVVTAFVTLVAGAQAVLFGGNRPRLASIVAGSVLLPTCIWTTILVLEGLPRSLGVEFIIAITVGTAALALSGAGCGYLTGAVIAGVFLGDPHPQANHDAQHTPDPLAPEPLAPEPDPFAPTETS